MRFTLTMAAIAAAALAGPAAAQTPDRAEVALHAAMKKESVDGDLKDAIEQYKKLAQGANKPVAALALVRLGECYEKQGNADARKTYEQVLSKFGDQKEAVAQARARLAALGGGRTGQMTNTLVGMSDKLDLIGSVSPDGRYVSFPDWKTGNLGLHDLVSGADRYLTTTGNLSSKGDNGYAETSIISKDGKQVAYAWYDKDNSGELWVANVSGDPAPRRLYAAGNGRGIAPFDWSHDGRWIAVSVSPAKGQSERTYRIGLIAARDGSLRVLQSLAYRGRQSEFQGVCFSPDGKYLAYGRFVGETDPQRDVFLFDIDEGREIPVVTGPTREVMVGWSPDGRYLLFTSDRTGTESLWALPIANGAPQGAPERLKEDLKMSGRTVMRIASSGTLYYGVRPGRALPRIQVAQFDSGAAKLLSPPVDVAQGNERAILPRWSADSKYLAYGSQSASFSIKIWAVETGRILREIRPKLEGGGLLGNLLGWAPDGSYFVSGTGSQVFRVDAVTGDASLLSKWGTGRFPGPPEWSPDGQRIYYRKGAAGSHALVELDLASGSERELIRRDGIGTVKLSPDGRYIATTCIDSSRNSRTMLLIPVTGGEPRELMRVPAEVDPAELRTFSEGAQLRVEWWAPDSRSVLVRKLFSDAKQPEELWQVPLDGGAPHKLGGNLDLGQDGRGAALFIAPDGRHVAIVPATAPAEQPIQVWALDNFLPAAKAASAAK